MTGILVTGASGRLGRAVIRSLSVLAPRTRVHALVRRADTAADLRRRGVHARLADYRDPAALAEAFAGIDRLLFISSPELRPAVRWDHHRAVLDAAEGVGHIVYTSVHGADHDPAHAATEAALRERGGATILRNGFYTEPFLVRALDDAQGGTVVSATSGQPLATAAVDDLAEAAARALLAVPTPLVRELRGPAWTYDELAELLGVRLGRPVRHRDVPVGEAGPSGPLHAAAASGALAAETPDLGRLLGRPPRGIAGVLTQLPLR